MQLGEYNFGDTVRNQLISGMGNLLLPGFGIGFSLLTKILIGPDDPDYSSYAWLIAYDVDKDGNVYKDEISGKGKNVPDISNADAFMKKAAERYVTAANALGYPIRPCRFWLAFYPSDPEKVTLELHTSFYTMKGLRLESVPLHVERAILATIQNTPCLLDSVPQIINSQALATASSETIKGLFSTAFDASENERKKLAILSIDNSTALQNDVNIFNSFLAVVCNPVAFAKKLYTLWLEILPAASNVRPDISDVGMNIWFYDPAMTVPREIDPQYVGAGNESYQIIQRFHGYGMRSFIIWNWARIVFTHNKWFAAQPDLMLAPQVTQFFETGKPPYQGLPRLLEAIRKIAYGFEGLTDIPREAVNTINASFTRRGGWFLPMETPLLCPLSEIYQDEINWQNAAVENLRRAYQSKLNRVAEIRAGIIAAMQSQETTQETTQENVTAESTIDNSPDVQNNDTAQTTQPVATAAPVAAPAPWFWLALGMLIL